MSNSTLTGQALGQVSNLGLNLRKTVVDETKKTAQAVTQQIGFETATDKKTSPPQAQQNAHAPQQPQVSPPPDGLSQPAPTSEDTKQFLKELYGVPSDMGTQVVEKGKNPMQQMVQNMAANHKDMKPEDLQKLASLRQQLHQQIYYQPTFNRPQPKEEPVTEKLEKEKKMEMLELQKKEEKKPQKVQLPGSAENRMGKGIGA